MTRYLPRLPQPEKSKAQALKIVDRVILNCQFVPGDLVDLGDAVRYSVGPNPPEPLDSIARKLSLARNANPELKVVIRADKRLRYEQVRAVMEIVAASHIENMSLVAHVGTGDE